MQTATQVTDLAERLANFIATKPASENEFCTEVAGLLAPMLATPLWIPPELMLPSPAGYRRETLYEDPNGQFAIACLTWAPGQATPIHDHNSWDVFGVVQGALSGETFDRDAASGDLFRRGHTEIVGSGSLTAVQPESALLPDIHRMSSATSEVTVSIHVIGCLLSEINRNRYPAF